MIAESINEVKYPQLNIKVEDSLKKKVEKGAKELGVNTSELVRKAIKKEIGEE